MKVKDFKITIKSESDGSFRSWVDSPAGEQTQDIPIDPAAVDDSKRLQDDLLKAIRTSNDAEADKVAQRLGKTLARAVFKGPAGLLLEKHLGHINKRDDGILRIRLETFTTDLRHVAPMPWELLPQPGEHAFFSQNAQTPIVRHPRITLQANPQPFTPPLRILVASASPDNRPTLDLATERASIAEAVQSLGDDEAQATFLNNASLASVQKALEQAQRDQAPYHVFHFMGHGHFKGEGSLSFIKAEDENKSFKKGHRVTGRVLADLLHKHKVGLVFLNACKSGTAGPSTRGKADTEERGTRGGGKAAPDLPIQQTDSDSPSTAQQPALQEAALPLLSQPPAESLPLLEPIVWEDIALWTKERANNPAPAPEDVPAETTAPTPTSTDPWATAAPWDVDGAVFDDPILDPLPPPAASVQRTLWTYAAPWARYMAYRVPWASNVPWAPSTSWAHAAPWVPLHLDFSVDDVRGDGATDEVQGDDATEEVQLDTGTSPPSDETFDPFGGTALALVNRGVPAVVAMQFAISDDAAKAFSKAFYQRILLGAPVDMAVNLGRIAIDTVTQQNPSAWVKPLEWMTPVLYMRATDGRLFDQDPSEILTNDESFQILLRKVKRAWIKEVLNASVSEGRLIGLKKTWAPDAVITPRSGPGHRPGLAGTQPIVDLFDPSEGTLLILGERGAGKTMRLLDVTRRLLPRAEAFLDKPVPVVFDLATWSGTSLRKWLMEEMATKYQIPIDTCRRWLTTDRVRILPLLDGLDAVEDAQRETCVEAINEGLTELDLPGLVVTCRNDVYAELKAAGHRLDFDAALHLEPLTSVQVDAHLAQTRLQPSRARIENIQTPETLEVLTRTYDGTQPTSPSPDGFLDDYIDQAFARNPEPDSIFSRARTMELLAWLAGRMQEHHQTVFLIERLEPRWLGSAWKRLLNLLMFAVPFGLIIGWLAARAWVMAERLDPTFDGAADPVMHAPFWLWWLTITVWALVAGTLDRLWEHHPFMKERISDDQPRRIRILVSRAIVFSGLWALIWILVSLLPSADTFFPNYTHPTIVGVILIGLYVMRVNSLQFIQTRVPLGWNWPKGWRGVLHGVLGGVLVWLIYVASSWEALPWISEDATGAATFGHLARNLLLYPPLGAAGGFVFGGLRRRIWVRKTYPNQGMLLSVTNGLKGGMAAGLLLGLVSFFIFFFVFPVPEALQPETTSFSLALWGAWYVTMIMATIAFLWYGGIDILRHTMLRIVFQITEKRPFLMAAFLNHTSRLGLTKKAGGGYLFANRTLQHHFAEMEGSPKAYRPER